MFTMNLETVFTNLFDHKAFLTLHPDAKHKILHKKMKEWLESTNEIEKLAIDSTLEDLTINHWWAENGQRIQAQQNFGVRPGLEFAFKIELLNYCYQTSLPVVRRKAISYLIL